MSISIIERFEPADNNRSGKIISFILSLNERFAPGMNIGTGKIISFILWLNGGLLSEIMGSRQRLGLTASLAVSEEGEI